MDVIDRTIGGIGKWQILIYISTSIIKFPTGWMEMSSLYLTPLVNFTCSDQTLGKCNENCTFWIYDRSHFEETIVTEFDLVCSKAYLAPMQQTVFMFGILIGNLGFSILADKYGRHRIMMISYGLSGVFGTLLFISPNYNVFISLRFVNGMAIGGFMISSFVIIIEIVGRKWRDLFAVIYHLPFNMAHATIPFLAYYVNNWKYYCLAQSIPILCLLPYYFIGPESPRWLYTHGELEKSIKILVKAAKINGKPYEEVTTTVETCAAQHSEEHGRGNFLDLFKTPNIRKKTMVTCFCWFSCGITFFGIAQYITFLGNDPFTPEAISASLAFPASMILYFLCKFWGRKKTLMLAFLVQLIPMIILIFLNENSVAPQICVCVALFGTMIAFPVLYLYTGELMPTVIRNAGVGIGSTVSVMGSMISPHIPGLKTISSYVPPLLFTIFPSIAFFMVVMLPETRNRKLPETIDDAESFGKNVS